MTKTRVDDMLIEMISPKVKEIEEKFSRGDGLTQEDINTLLLKSQYNHINHLDDKLNEVTASVVALEGRFEKKFSELEGKFQGLEGKFQELEGRFQTFKAEMSAEFEKRIGGLENKFSSLETKFSNLETKFESAQVRMQETIISTMKWYIGGAGVVLILLKALDIFVK
jgi:chromosome segregation ATPase